jgi:hypothetical protein
VHGIRRNLAGAKLTDESRQPAKDHWFSID